MLTEQENLELEWLRYFYANVEDCLGPASDDIYEAIADDYIREGNRMPDREK
jgi:hypothetical protein